MNSLKRDLDDGERVVLKDGSVGTVEGGFGMQAATMGSMILFRSEEDGFAQRRDGREIDPEATKALKD